MMISTKGRYALRLMIDIAEQGPEGTLVSMRQAAQRQGLSIKYLEQLGRCLVKAGLLRSIRGVSGGYLLARSAKDITIAQIMDATEGTSAPLPCVEDASRCEKSTNCSARGFWVGLGGAIQSYAEGVTLADLAKSSS